MKKFHTQKGITLIALIITIIVLLILAVVAIGAVQNDGIIQYAKNARDDYQAAQDNEAAMLNTYLGYLDNEVGATGGSGEGGGDDETGGNTEAFASITASNYGDSITYSAGGVTDWKVFYKDSNNLYIIASDYLANTNLPTGLNMSTYTDYPYSAYWSSTSNFTSTGSADITSAIAAKYNLTWLNDNASSTNNNARATADLLNTTAWTAKFASGIEGAEAIGGPTLEMWVASWNASGYTPLYTAYDATGYYVGTGTDPKTDESYYISLSSDTAGYADTLYFPHTSAYSNCYGYWLASPSANDSRYVVYVRCNGYVGNDHYSNGSYGVRPLVSLPSDVISTNADGSLKVVQ